MLPSIPQAVLVASVLHSQATLSQGIGSCSVDLKTSYPAPVVAAGFSARLISTGLQRPRGLIFDKNKGLLVVESRTGISHITFSSDDGATCLAVGKTVNLVRDTSLTHGIELSPDGKTLYASSSDKVFSWDYDAAAITATNQKTLIQNMTNTDHITRTLLLSKKQPEILLVSRGSGENIDFLAAQQSSGISQIRAFNLSALGDGQVYDYPSQGVSLGWGLRNSVGVAEHPVTGGIYSVENSADQLRRHGTDIHEENPGEELNFHGALNATPASPPNYGYPHCFALWDTSIPSPGSLRVGSQFALDDTATVNDTACAADFTSPRLTFEAHTAPLDIKFTAAGDTAYVTFHGSWNRDHPAGYKLSSIAFGAADGTPVDPANSKTAAVDVLTNQDTARCPGNCFRPAGLVVDDQGRLFMTSDSTGEIYVLQRVREEAGGGAGGGAGGNGAESRAGQSPRGDGWVVVGLTVMLSVVGGVFFAAA
ncbi:soluble quino protein glucose/sorbosone dehydrogenase [Lasiosphaeris hirsuta]|uniref:Soluble quino protein glucose/sorbosone dehydrogenase n=1 Tax=Lasiosphaeris hirsuta TaxID=260670 RepID=A0AA40DLN9_9PEZI|nr:soluble quino protein glucose/sorbosone dehydrogenase [Lasiosphaeris hirsuta]